VLLGVWLASPRVRLVVVLEGFALPDQSQLASVLPILAFAAIFWLLLVRPAQRRRKTITTMQAELSVGDSVMMSSGVLGTIRGLTNDRVQLEVAPAVVITVARGAISEHAVTTTDALPADAHIPETES
jgi:preprotein translocase subunit YajC